MKSVEQTVKAAKDKIDELGNALNVDSVKSDIKDKTISRDKMEASLNAVDNEISSLHKLSSLTAEFELNKSALKAKEAELDNLKQKHGDKIKELLNIQELQHVKVKSSLERVHQQLVCDLLSLLRYMQEHTFILRAKAYINYI